MGDEGWTIRREAARRPRPQRRSLSPFLARAAVTAAIAFVCGLGGAMTAAHWPRAAAPTAPAAQTGSDRARYRERVDALLGEIATLSPEQKGKIRIIDQNYIVDYNLIYADLKASDTELAAALAKDMSLNDDAKTAIKEIELNVGQMQTSTVNYILAVRAVLTPAQRMIFDDRIIADIM